MFAAQSGRAAVERDRGDRHGRDTHDGGDRSSIRDRRGHSEAARRSGERVIGVDLADADVDADLSTHEGRASMVAAVAQLADGPIDAVVANAGSAAPAPMTVSINYFGAVATLEGLLPLMVGSAAPRAVITSSMASFLRNDEELVAAMLGGDEPAALARAQALVEAGEESAQLIYGSTKNAINRWMRTVAPTDDWAGAGIPINAVVRASSRRR
jgi:NAD(P)-dependent dehydrogenase (short-subunit alcohol dehydrogenase family)